MKTRIQKAVSAAARVLAIAGLLGGCALDFGRFDPRGDAGAPSGADAAADTSPAGDSSIDRADARAAPDSALDGAPADAFLDAPGDTSLSVDAPSEAAAGDSGCGAGATCTSDLESCIATCVSQHTQCLATCGVSGCATLCDAAEQACESPCARTCTKCAQRAGCSSAAVCPDGG